MMLANSPGICSNATAATTAAATVAAATAATATAYPEFDSTNNDIPLGAVVTTADTSLPL